jgi:hypothetical protein
MSVEMIGKICEFAAIALHHKPSQRLPNKGFAVASRFAEAMLVQGRSSWA